MSGTGFTTVSAGTDAGDLSERLSSVHEPSIFGTGCTNVSASAGVIGGSWSRSYTVNTYRYWWTYKRIDVWLFFRPLSFRHFAHFVKVDNSTDPPAQEATSHRQHGTPAGIIIIIMFILIYNKPFLKNLKSSGKLCSRHIFGWAPTLESLVAVEEYSDKI